MCDDDADNDGVKNFRVSLTIALNLLHVLTPPPLSLRIIALKCTTPNSTTLTGILSEMNVITAPIIETGDSQILMEILLGMRATLISMEMVT